MELHQRLTNLVQKETDRLLKEFLNDNPDLLEKYVQHGVTAVGLILTPLNAFMRHLLVVKGLDPDEVPGERLRREINQAITSLFDPKHTRDFDDDYDFSWVHKKFEEARGHMKELTKEKFLELTDISKLPNIGPSRYPTIDEEQDYINKRPSTYLPEKEIPVSEEENPIDKLRSTLKDLIKETADKSSVTAQFKRDASKFNPGDAIKKIESVFEEINKLPKKGIKTNKKKVNKGPNPKGAPAWGAKGNKVNRVHSTPAERQEYAIKLEALRDIGWEKKARARALANEMVERGLVVNETQAIEKQFEEIVMWTDEAIESMERVVRKNAKLPTDDKFTGSFRRAKK